MINKELGPNKYFVRKPISNTTQESEGESNLLNNICI